MDNETSIQRGLDVLNVMTLDPVALWDGLDENTRHQLAQMLQHWATQIESVQHSTETECVISQLAAVTADIVHLVEATPTLTTMLMPHADHLTSPPILGIRKVDLGDTENERQSRIQRFVAQIRNSLVLLQQKAPPAATYQERRRP